MLLLMKYFLSTPMSTIRYLGFINLPTTTASAKLLSFALKPNSSSRLGNPSLFQILWQAYSPPKLRYFVDEISSGFTGIASSCGNFPDFFTALFRYGKATNCSIRRSFYFIGSFGGRKF